MTARYSHVALIVPDLQAAEGYYQRLFGMELMFREAEGKDGMWYTLPPGKGYADADAAGITLSMVALRLGDFILPLFPGDPQPGQIFVIGLQMAGDQLDALRERLGRDELVMDPGPQLMFQDRYGTRWQIAELGGTFQSNGEIGGRWLEV